jgi:O-antigen/teichoic acid export membrane protein
MRTNKLFLSLMLARSRTLIFSFFQGHQRTVRAKKNAIASLLIKGGSVLVGFMLVPITLNYLDQTRYGIWVTITSFLTWFTFFEIGLGSGLKNKLAEAVAKNNYELGRTYVSTTYAILTIVISIVSVAFFIGSNYIDWTRVFNTGDASLGPELTKVAYIVFGFFFFRFVIKLIGDVLLAHQRSGLSNLFGPLGNFLSLPIIYLLTKFTEGSLIYIGLTFSLVPVVVLLVASLYLYTHEYKHIAPSIKFVKFKYAKELLNVGVKFFIIQASALVIFQSANFIIIQFFGPEEVTSFDVAFKYFSIINMIFTIIVLPYWPAFTEAWAKEDIAWIRRTITNLLKLWGGFVVMALLMFVLSDIVFYYWIGAEKMKVVSISMTLKILLILYFLIFTFGGVFNMFINGVGKVTLQTYSLLLGAALFVPCTYFFIHYLNWGIESVVLGSIIANFYSLIIAPIQYFKIINNKAQGIWNK